jgi:hypothetical protein
MFVDEKEIDLYAREIDSGLSGFEKLIRGLNSWVIKTRHFVFGYGEIIMTPAATPDSTSLILSNLSLNSKESLKTIPHVVLEFKNQEGLDALITSLQNLKILKVEEKPVHSISYAEFLTRFFPINDISNEGDQHLWDNANPMSNAFKEKHRWHAIVCDGGYRIRSGRAESNVSHSFSLYTMVPWERLTETVFNDETDWPTRETAPFGPKRSRND